MSRILLISLLAVSLSPGIALPGETPPACTESGDLRILRDKGPPPCVVPARKEVGAPPEYRKFIRQAAKKYSLSEELLVAVISVVSGFDPGARSRDGKLGLTHITEETARSMHVRDVWDPEENISGGARYLRTLANGFDGDLVRTLRIYAGPQGSGGVEESGGDAATQDRVRRILKAYEKLRSRR